MRKLMIAGAACFGAWSSFAYAQSAPTAQDGQDEPGRTPPLLTTPATHSPSATAKLTGFVDIALKNDYVTPAGLVVTTKGATVQVVNGLSLVTPSGLAFSVGSFTDLNPGYSKADGNITSLNEIDVFAGVSGTLAKRWKLNLQYLQFISGQPSVAFKNTHNIAFSVAYDDGSPGKRFTLNPYAKLFWQVAGKSSTVVLGKPGGTFDIELGAVPTLSLDGVTLTAPTYVTVGPSEFWGTGAFDNGQNFGVAATALKASVPVTALQSGGKMSVYGQVQYFHLINDNLVRSKAILNSGANGRDHFVFGIGTAVAF
jgi:hypothetical protein